MRGSTGFDHGSHFLCAAWAHHGKCLAMHTLAPVLLIGAEVTIGQYMGCADDVAQLCQKCGLFHVSLLSQCSGVTGAAG